MNILPLPPVFAVREHEILGVTRGQIEGPKFARPFRGVRAIEAPVTLPDRVFAINTVVSGDWAVSHQTAARLWGAPLPASTDERIHILNTFADLRRRLPGVVSHRHHVELEQLSDWNGIRITRPGMTWIHLAEQLKDADLIAVGDYFLTNMLMSVDEVRALLTLRSRHRGVERARRVIDLIREPVLSAQESIARFVLMVHGLPEPACNPKIRFGSVTLKPDLGYLKERVAIEYEGDYHREKQQFRSDIKRRSVMEDAGWVVVRIMAEDLAGYPFSEPCSDFAARVSRLLKSSGQKTR